MRQSILKALIGTALIGLCSAPAFADNIAESESTGDHNVSTITQTGDNQDGKVKQTGNHLTSTITQVDFGNKSTVKQAGEHNVSTITQEAGNIAMVDQGGNHNTSTINQDPTTNNLGSTFSEGNTADVTQRGAWNQSTVNQFVGNNAEVDQTGTGTSDEPNTVLINQYKNEDVAVAAQTGGAGNSIEINQSVDCCSQPQDGNQVGPQGGLFSDVQNFATAEQHGSFNTTLINQRALQTQGQER